MEQSLGLSMRLCAATVHETEDAMSEKWLKMSMGDLGRGIGDGSIDPIELTQTYLNAIDAHPFRDRIYARVTSERALAEAKSAAERARLGVRRGLLDGVPISWKDLFDTAGTATEAGTALLKGRIPEDDAKVLQNATLAGTVCLGKTHMSELAFSGLGYNPITATPPSVNDLDAVAGGSSSGAAASVAFDIAPCGIGSDTGGSVRIPAVWNDLVGLKTTSERLSLKGVVPLAVKFDTVGPLCRTVEDAALMLAALEGSNPIDLAGSSLSGRRIGVLKTVAMDDLQDQPRAGFQSAIERLQAAGAIVEYFEFPEIEEAMRNAGPLYTAECYATWGQVIEQSPEKMFPEILNRFRAGKDVAAADYEATWQRLLEIRENYHSATAGFDAVAIPTAPTLPPNVKRLEEDSEYYVSENLAALRNTRIGNLMGVCALTLPTGLPATGLMLMAAPFQEERLLRIGSAAEEALA